jgi:hypothetical protein
MLGVSTGATIFALRKRNARLKLVRYQIGAGTKMAGSQIGSQWRFWF